MAAIERRSRRSRRQRRSHWSARALPPLLFLAATAGADPLPEWAVDPSAAAPAHGAHASPTAPVSSSAHVHAPLANAPVAPRAGADAAGACDVRPSADRTALELVDSLSGDVRHVIAFGRDRVEVLYRSDDAHWALAVVRARGGGARVAQAIDRTACTATVSFAVADAPTSARFVDDRVDLSYADGSGLPHALKAP